MTIGQSIVQSGLLVRDGGGFALRADGGGRILLDLHRLPVDHVEKRVRISGIYVSETLVEVESIAAIR
jgi:hypothetical protein